MHVNYATYDCEMRRDAICVLYAYAYAMGDCSDRRGWMDPWNGGGTPKQTRIFQSGCSTVKQADLI
jgi:hypothetical protein